MSPIPDFEDADADNYPECREPVREESDSTPIENKTPSPDENTLKTVTASTPDGKSTGNPVEEHWMEVRFRN